MNKSDTYKFKRNFYKKPNKRATLDVNVKGFLCSCNNREKDCVKESYNLLNKYADMLYPHTTIQTESDADIDIEDELKHQISQLKSNKTERRFQVVDSGAKNMIFITTTVDDPVQLAHAIVSDIEETKSRQSRFLIRLVPIEVTCKAYLKDIENAFKPLAAKHFAHESKTFSIIYNHRNNNNLNKDDVIKVVADAIFELNSDHKVNLKQAEVSVIIEIIKGIALIGVVPNFIKYKKYNLLAVSDNLEEAIIENSTEAVSNSKVENSSKVNSILKIENPSEAGSNFAEAELRSKMA